MATSFALTHQSHWVPRGGWYMQAAERPPGEDSGRVICESDQRVRLLPEAAAGPGRGLGQGAQGGGDPAEGV